jgi:hypothetical protein
MFAHNNRQGRNKKKNTQIQKTSIKRATNQTNKKREGGWGYRNHTFLETSVTILLQGS